ncbi:MAG: carbohydrate-binding protein SusD [Mucilaginibacter sp.]|nr:carbohydrate-binding protein SusD [Mucilaginibacter sp.]
MKSYKKIAFVLTTLGVIGVSGCKKILDQSPKANVTPDVLASAGGVVGGITGVYSDLRNLWGTEGFLYYTNLGVDETLAGGGASNGGVAFATYKNYTNNVSDVYNALGGVFNIAYQDINTLNGVLQYGVAAFPDAPTRTAYLAQAKFLRALYYFHLVQTFGSVPLHTAFINTATLSDSRAPVADIYNQIIKDLTEASAELQNKPGENGSPFAGHAATKASALYLLSKAYLTRGWSSAAQSGDFQSALTTAQTLISTKATYGVDLYQNYADAYAPANDATNKEDLFAIEHSTDTKYGDFTPGASGGKINGWAYFFRPNYPTVNANYPASGGSGVMTRDIANGRPFFRVRPNYDYVNNIAFADRSNDYRYWNTFQTTWIANTANITTPRGALTVGTDTAIWMPPYDPGADKRASFKGVIFLPPSVAATTTGANASTNTFFPALKKFDDPNRPSVNDPSSRPVVLFRFSEIYLIAAEAAYKLSDLTTAANMINVLRTRAAYRNTGMPANAVANMQIAPAQVTLDFILDERTRELYGESLRWWDLTRTQSLIRRVKLYNAEAAPNIQDFMTLRPIPQTEINLVTQGPPIQQNPGF